MPFLLKQAIKASVTANQRQITFFSADKLRKALLAAGDIVYPEEIPEVLSYVCSDGRYEELDGLHLILLSTGSVQQVKLCDDNSKKYFVFTDTTSESIYNLMGDNKHQLVEICPAWRSLAM